jgi:hypothetical protein
VRHHDHTGLDAVAQLREFDPGAVAERRVEVGQRLVEQEQLRVLDDRSADRDPLPLPARHLPRLFVEVRRNLEHLGGRGDPPLNLVARRARVLEAEGHVLPHRHVRIERIGLEHHCQVPLARRERVDAAAVQPHLARIRGFKAGDDAEQGRFAATGRAEKGDELARLHLERDAVQDQRVAEGFANVAER